VTVTFTGIGDGSRTDSVQYVDVGVKLDIEPTIQLDDSVATKLSLEVSSVSGRQTTESGTQVLTITTTNAQTALTLKNGERTIIGGLIRDDFAKSRNTIPGIGSIPLIGNLFTSHSRRKAKREILLSITPYIIKSLEIPNPETASIWSGAEEDLKAGPTFAAFAAGPVESWKPAPQLQAAPEPSLPADAAAAPQRSAAAPMPDEKPDGYTAPTAMPAPPGSPLVFFSGPARVAIGEEFTMTLKAAEMRSLLSAPLYVTYDPERLEFVQIREGTFLGQGGISTIFTTSADSIAGRVLVGYRQGAGGQGASGGGDLFQVVFRARSAGEAILGLAGMNFRDRDGARLSVQGAEAAVEVW
jgi:general secretion pathway protein D